MRIVIIEDEKLSAEHLVSLLKKVDTNIEIVKYLDTIKGTINELHNRIECDLIFMDIHLADGNSFEIFNEINIETPIIFTTAYDNYAIQAFKQNSIDYLLKPIVLKDVQLAIEKFKKHHNRINKLAFETFTNYYKKINTEYKTRFIVKVGETIDTIPTSDIHHFETKASFSFLVTNTGKKYIIEYSLDQVEKLLQPMDFFRINRKIIIQIHSIVKVKPYFNSRLLIDAKYMDNDAPIVSRERVADFKKWLDK
jgi:DNA-binding LytR/AlgR family response regulator